MKQLVYDVPCVRTRQLPIMSIAQLFNRQNAIVFPVVLVGFILLSAASLHSGDAKEPSSRIIQYRGSMPMLPRDSWGSETEITFELYRSPTGGSPFWTESRKVSVEKNNAEVSVDLGEEERLPDEAFTTSFRFLSILHNGFELGPRKQVASVVYVASEYELDYTQENYLEKSLIPAIKAAKDLLTHK
jgi:hypothetical protein